jgi:hypothetical protein
LFVVVVVVVVSFLGSLAPLDFLESEVALGSHAQGSDVVVVVVVVVVVDLDFGVGLGRGVGRGRGVGLGRGVGRGRGVGGHVHNFLVVFSVAFFSSFLPPFALGVVFFGLGGVFFAAGFGFAFGLDFVSEFHLSFVFPMNLLSAFFVFVPQDLSLQRLAPFLFKKVCSA